MTAKSLARIFAENVQRKRRHLGLTQEDLAARLGIAQQSMSRMERGVMTPKFERLPDIARELHCTVAALFVEPEAGDRDTREVVTDILEELSATERGCVLRFVIEAAALFKGASPSV